MLASVLNLKHPKEYLISNILISIKQGPPADIIEGSDKNLSKQINYCYVMGTDQIVIYVRRVFAGSEVELICVGGVYVFSADEGRIILDK